MADWLFSAGSYLFVLSYLLLGSTWPFLLPFLLKISHRNNYTLKRFPIQYKMYKNFI